MVQISEHVTWAEATKSQTAIRYGIDNTPNPEALLKMRVVANLVFEPVREYFGKPIAVVSFYRSPKLNIAIGGAVGSQHMKGEAMDIDADVFGNGITNKKIFDFIRKYLEFDQLIWELGDDNNPDWVHVSYVDNIKNRRNVLRAFKKNGVVNYQKYGV